MFHHLCALACEGLWQLVQNMRAWDNREACSQRNSLGPSTGTSQLYSHTGRLPERKVGLSRPLGHLVVGQDKPLKPQYYCEQQNGGGGIHWPPCHTYHHWSKPNSDKSSYVHMRQNLRESEAHLLLQPMGMHGRPRHQKLGVQRQTCNLG